nr:hypothetical protein GCM10020185_32610 [Pseudomonas brassicacearum subsp. brassicacearum]
MHLRYRTQIPGHGEERKEESCLMSTKKPTVNKSQLAGTDTLDRGNTNAKLESLEQFRSDATEQALRTNQGVKIADNQNTLRAGPPAALRCWKTSSCVKKSRTLTMSVSRSASSTPVGPAPMVIFRATMRIRH